MSVPGDLCRTRERIWTRSPVTAPMTAGKSTQGGRDSYPSTRILTFSGSFDIITFILADFFPLKQLSASRTHGHEDSGIKLPTRHRPTQWKERGNERLIGNRSFDACFHFISFFERFASEWVPFHSKT